MLDTGSASWSHHLRSAREELGLSRPAAAELASVSAETIKGYELGRRKPSRELLEQIITALGIEQAERNSILTGAGFVGTATLFPPEVAPDYYFTRDQVAEEIERAPWPACVVNDRMDVVAANRLVLTLWDVDFERELTGPGERNLLSIASTPHFVERVENWEEAVGVAVAILKGHHTHRGGVSEPEDSSGYFASVLQHFLDGDPKYVARFLTVWQDTPAREAKCHWDFPVVWRDEDHGTLRFRVAISVASEPDGLMFNDWIPLDAATWEALERLKRKGRARAE